MKSKRTLIFIPTYNEHDNARAICEQIVELGIDADLLFCDDNSPDGTGGVVDELAAKHPRVFAMHRTGKLGIGSAHLDGIAYAYERHYERLLTMDCDFTHMPQDIPRMIASADASGAALVVASRWHGGESLPGWSPLRKALTTLGHVVTKNMLGVTNDATGAFRLYDLQKIPQRLFDLVTEKGYAFFFRSMFILTENNFEIVEIPIVLAARTYGHSKMSLVEVKRSVEQLGKLILARQTNPAQFRLSKQVADLDPELVDPQDWDAYWEKKDRAGALLYDAIAAAYRNVFIKSNLNRVIHQEFGRGDRLLHAGCGSGQVDTDLHAYVDVTAVDISPQALSRYSRENPHVHQVRHADILKLPFADGSFDGVYNLGVVEHFGGADLGSLFSELARVTRPGGKVVTFWPHKYATSAFVLDSVHYVLNDVMKKGVQLHPPEPSRIGSRADAQKTFADAGLDLVRYDFGPRDLYVQAIAVGKRREGHA